MGARLQAAGSQVWLATRDAEYAAGDGFELIVLATKAHDAIDVAPMLTGLVSPGSAVAMSRA